VAVLLPLECEGFYLPGLEAMALGTPVVSLDAVGNLEYLRPDENACVVTPDVDALAEAAIRLLSDQDRAAALAAAGAATARGFSLEGERAAFREILMTTVGRA
jgi:glycosyltransferase involved in cell wall biosynthesis